MDAFKDVLLNSTKIYEDKKSFFISHSIHFSDVYKPTSALKKNESYTLNLLESLKHLCDSSESVTSRKRAVSLEKSSVAKLKLVLNNEVKEEIEKKKKKELTSEMFFT